MTTTSLRGVLKSGCATVKTPDPLLHRGISLWPMTVVGRVAAVRERGHLCIDPRDADPVFAAVAGVAGARRQLSDQPCRQSGCEGKGGAARLRQRVPGGAATINHDMRPRSVSTIGAVNGGGTTGSIAGVSTTPAPLRRASQ
jgi:hypothetical protein